MEAQQEFFDAVGRENYIKLPKPGTNPRGVEITKDALSSLIKDDRSKALEIYWQRPIIDYNPYKKWVEYW